MDTGLYKYLTTVTGGHVWPLYGKIWKFQLQENAALALLLIFAVAQVRNKDTDLQTCPFGKTGLALNCVLLGFLLRIGWLILNGSKLPINCENHLFFDIL